MSTEGKKQETRGRFSGRLGYVLATAGSAVGLGNLWRFPYLAANYGGLFLIIYLILVVTFGYTMIVSETALGRMTGKGPVGAFRTFGKGRFFRFGGWMNAVIPMIIASYYCAIGGWVLKYLFEYLRGNGVTLTTDGYFDGFIASTVEAEVFFLLFAACVFLVIAGGVKGGIERISKIMMPLLLLLAVFVAVYSVTRPGAIEGVKHFLIPKLPTGTPLQVAGKIAKTIVAALGQMFFSLSVAMGALYTYGSYMGKDMDIEKSTVQVELFDTGIALLAGLMIIPAVFAFGGGTTEQLSAGPALMFDIIPKVFGKMGFSRVMGIVFFVLVFFAALTSAISLLESMVATFQDELHWGRAKGGILAGVIVLSLGSCSVFGYGMWSSITILKMSILSFLDFLTNSVMMPLAAICTCILIAWFVGVDKIAQEVGHSSAFSRGKIYGVIVKYVAPVLIVAVLFSSIAEAFGWIQF